MVEFDWDDHNIEYILEHGIESYEAEQVFEDMDRCSLNAHSGRKKLVGMTDDGRILTIIYEMRGKKIRVCTGWDAAEYERKSYNRRRR